MTYQIIQRYFIDLNLYLFGLFFSVDWVIWLAFSLTNCFKVTNWLKVDTNQPFWQCNFFSVLITPNVKKIKNTESIPVLFPSKINGNQTYVSKIRTKTAYAGKKAYWVLTWACLIDPFHWWVQRPPPIYQIGRLTLSNYIFDHRPLLYYFTTWTI